MAAVTITPAPAQIVDALRDRILSKADVTEQDIRDCAKALFDFDKRRRMLHSSVKISAATACSNPTCLSCDAHLIETDDHYGQFWKVKCWECGACTGDRKTVADAINAWGLSKFHWRSIVTAPRIHDEQVITFDGCLVRTGHWQYGNNWQADGVPSHIPTHWMPMPTWP